MNQFWSIIFLISTTQFYKVRSEWSIADRDWDCINLAQGKTPEGFALMEEHQTWEGYPTTELREGDLLLREMNFNLYHAGIYCGKNEVIDFTGRENSYKTYVGSISSELSYGAVCKRTVKHFVNQKPYKILRKKGGIPEDFQKKVSEAMDLEKPYNLLTFNCLHFALRLLNNDESSAISTMPEGLQPLGGSCGPFCEWAFTPKGIQFGFLIQTFTTL